MRVFLDTNVLVSAVATRGLCADVLREVLKSHQLVISPTVLSELERGLRDKIRIPEAVIREFLAFLKQESDLTPSGRLPGISLLDKDDLKILSAAWNGKSELLITGDEELITLGKFKGLEIVSPRAFWERLRSSSLPKLKKPIR